MVLLHCDRQQHLSQMKLLLSNASCFALIHAQAISEDPVAHPNGT